MRRSLVVGNWKMNGTRASAELLAKGIIAGLGADVADIAVCVPYVYMPYIADLVKDSSLSLGSQNIADQASGAYTGEISATMLKEFNCQYALVGHSERRSYYGDTNESVAARFCQAQLQNIIPILIIRYHLHFQHRLQPNPFIGPFLRHSALRLLIPQPPRSAPLPCRWPQYHWMYRCPDLLPATASASPAT